MINLQHAYRKSPDVVARKVAGECILIPIRGRLADMQHVYPLDAVGERIWAALDGKATLAEIAAAVVEAFEVEPAAAGADAAEFVEDLLKAGLVLPAETA